MSGPDIEDVRKKLGEATHMSARSEAIAKQILEHANDRLAVVRRELEEDTSEKRTEKYESLIQEKGVLEQVIATAQSDTVKKS